MIRISKLISYGLFAASTLGVSLLQSCSHAPVTGQKMPLLPQKELRDLVEQVCRIGAKNQNVGGTAWLKAESPEVSGQFQGIIATKRGMNGATHELTLEVLNPLGGTEVKVEIRDNQYLISQVRKKKGQEGFKEQGNENWSGIPLRWAAQIFLGEIPCPKSKKYVVRQGESLSDEAEKVIIVQDENGDLFQFSVEKLKTGYFPKVLKLTSEKTEVEFHFDDPTEKTLEPQKWEAISKKGRVKLKWKERKVSLERESTPKV